MQELPLLHAQGRLDEAKSFAVVCREAAAPDDVAAQYQWHSIQAKLSATDGDLDEAELLAGEALRLIKSTDQPDILWRGVRNPGVRSSASP